MSSSAESTSEATRLFRNARLATMRADLPGIGAIEPGAILAQGGRILYAGPEAEAPGAAETLDCEGRWITPGLIDCHTHLVYAGDRAREFELRLEGKTYQEIAAAGGGIWASVRAARTASEETLVAEALPRLDALIAEGATTIEVKSGYGLEFATERRLLRAARHLEEKRPVEIVPTYLALHALPPEFATDRAAFIARVIEEDLPAIAAEGLAQAVDAFGETIAFAPAEIEPLFRAAARLRLPVKLHADQLSDQGGAGLAARHYALSADHLEHADEAGIAAMARSGTIAVLLPGASYFLRETEFPPIPLLRKHGVAIAIATDCNPGTSPLTSLLLTMNMAATLFRMTIAECLLGVTREAARALGRGATIGTLEAGKTCNLAIWSVDRPAELVYRLGFNPLHARIFKGTADDTPSR